MSDPTDPGGVGAAQAERGSRGTRIGDSGSPVGSPLTIILAVIAVVAGFLIFRSLDNGSDAGASLNPGALPTTIAVTIAGQTTLPAAGGGAAPTTAAARVTTGGTILVANASRVPGSAGRMTDTLKTAGYKTAEATDSTDEDNEPYPKTIVYYSVGVDMNLVNTLARDLGGATARTMPSPIPITGGSLGTATVLVMLGTDMADKPLAPTLAPGVTAPAAVGSQPSTT